MISGFAKHVVSLIFRSAGWLIFEGEDKEYYILQLVFAGKGGIVDVLASTYPGVMYMVH